MVGLAVPAGPGAGAGSAVAEAGGLGAGAVLGGAVAVITTLVSWLLADSLPLALFLPRIIPGRAS